MISERVKKSVGIGGYSRCGVNNGVVQAGIGRPGGQCRKQLAINGIAGGDFIFDQILSGSLNRYASPLSRNFQPNIQNDRDGAPYREV
jgi:hypothetical protein